MDPIKGIEGGKLSEEEADERQAAYDLACAEWRSFKTAQEPERMRVAADYHDIWFQGDQSQFMFPTCANQAARNGVACP